MNNNLIVISAFISNINKQKSINKYIEYGNYLLSEKIDFLKILFIEKYIYNEYFNDNKNKDDNYHDKISTCIFEYEQKQYHYVVRNNIIFVFFEKTDNYLYYYIDNITDFNINTDNYNKDTLDYIFVQCHKTEWMKIAIYLMNQIQDCVPILIKNNNNLQRYIWIDFGIYHIFNNEELFNTTFKTLHMQNVINRSINVRIGSCIHPSSTYHKDIYKNIAWYFAGGVFGGSKESLVKFATIMKEKCLQIIRERKHLMWEVNIWYLIYLEHPELFDIYMCNHTPSILANY